LRDLDKYVFINIVLATLKMKCANHGSFSLNLEEIIIKVKFDYLHENFNVVYMEQEHIITNVKKLVCKNEYKLIHVIVHLHIS